MLISKRFTFEASHILPKHPGKCSRLHGHSWGLVVVLEGDINPNTGMVCDYGELSEMVTKYVISLLDHQHLGCGNVILPDQAVDKQDRHYTTLQKPALGEDFYPTSENVARAVFKMLSPFVKEIKNYVRLFEIRIEETCTSAAVWRAVDESSATGER